MSISEVLLTVGRLPAYLEPGVAVALATLGAGHSATWRLCPERVAEISLLNLASVCSFLDYVAGSEGFRDSGEGMEGTRFRNLPWWEESVWLPVAIDPPPEPHDPSEPLFVGSSPGLLAELASIRTMSRLDLGAIPDGYLEMRNDFKAFSRSSFELAGRDAVIRRVWRGLNDAAEIAVRNAAPLWS